MIKYYIEGGDGTVSVRRKTKRCLHTSKGKVSKADMVLYCTHVHSWSAVERAQLNQCKKANEEREKREEKNRKVVLCVLLSEMLFVT